MKKKKILIPTIIVAFLLLGGIGHKTIEKFVNPTPIQSAKQSAKHTATQAIFLEEEYYWTPERYLEFVLENEYTSGPCSH